MSENRFDAKKFLEYKFTPRTDIINILKPKTAKTPAYPGKQQPLLVGLIKAFVIAFVIVAIIKIFFVETLTVSSDAMDPTLGYRDVVVINKISYGIVNPFWGAAQTRKLLGIVPNPLYGRLYQLSFSRYIVRLAKDPGRMDLVAIRSPAKGQEGRIMIKRIIGLPGERIAIKNGYVIINGKKFNDDHRVIHDRSNMAEKKLPYGTYFVLGDNRAKSLDSRSFGPLSGNDIVGQVMVRFWPVGKPRTVK